MFQGGGSYLVCIYIGPKRIRCKHAGESSLGNQRGFSLQCVHPLDVVPCTFQGTSAHDDLCCSAPAASLGCSRGGALRKDTSYDASSSGRSYCCQPSATKMKSRAENTQTQQNVQRWHCRRACSRRRGVQHARTTHLPCRAGARSLRCRGVPLSFVVGPPNAGQGTRAGHLPATPQALGHNTEQ